MTDPTAYQAPVDIPVCPRHPERESHVRCQRCGRPVCPECQRPAAVGVQCVDCVQQSARESRSVRTIFGGAVNPRGAVVVGASSCAFAITPIGCVDVSTTE